MSENDYNAERKPVRMVFTKSYNDLMSELDKDEPDQVQVRYYMTKLERLSQQLNGLDEKVKDWLFDNSKESEYDKEYETVESYREKYDMSVAKVDSFNKDDSVVCRRKSASSMLSDHNKRNLKLPKIELKKFNGEIKEWLSFWGQFSRINDDKSIEPEDKFQYLIQATVKGTRARDIVEGFPATSENYEKAISCLKARFGRTDMLTEFYIRELLGMVIRNFKSGNNKISTVQLYDLLEAHLRSLESIGMTKDRYAAILYPLVESCLPEDMIRAWLRSPFSKVDTVSDTETYKIKLDQLFAFLKSEVEGEERINLAKTGFRIENNRKGDRISHDEAPVPTAFNLFSGEKIKNKNCVFCGKFHESRDCFNAVKMTLDEKKDILHKKGVCFLCFRSGHRVKYCKVPVRCVVCGIKHNSLLCTELPINKDKKRNENTTVASYCSSGEIILQTLKVQLFIRGHSRVVRALIDSGSQRSYILKRLVNELDIEPVGCEELTQILFGGKVCKKAKHGRYSITISDLHAKCSKEIMVLDQTTICGNIPKLKPEMLEENIKEKGIFLTDMGYDISEIELLIGADFASEILTGNQCKLECGLLAVETVLGWVVMGKTGDGGRGDSQASMVVSLLSQADRLADLWSLEALGISDPAENKSKREMELAAMDFFKKTVSRDSEGRYKICLPWLDNREELSDSRVIAEKRLVSMSRKLSADGKYEAYEEVLRDWIQEGVIEVVPDDQLQDPAHYIPHRGVFKASSTTKVRPVFDASCKQRGMLSLNDCLERGPNLLELIPAILLRFRENKIGVTSDIKKAFLQISVNEKDRDFLRFLWWESPACKKVKVMRHCRVVFGVNCSPFLLGAVLNHHLDESEPEFSDVSAKLKNSLYVDNCVASVGTEDELMQFIEYSTNMLSRAKFELRGWESTVSPAKNIKLSPSPVLGLLWDRGSDCLSCNIDGIEIPEGEVTRRNILSTTCKLFDPLGFICPVTLTPKILLQESWRQKLSWDSEVSEELKVKFMKWVKDLPNLSHIKIPRCVNYFPGGGTYSLHTFCDACKSSYAAVVYLRRECENFVEVSLLQAKARVAPLKQMTITRLELLACCIGDRLAHSVREAMHMDDISCYFWTDSTTALSWIKINEQLSVFVRNRVKNIREVTNIDDWRYVPGHMNPSDLPSRGCSAGSLLQSRWWEGPCWLRQEKRLWPVSKYEVNEEEVAKEKVKGVVSNVVSEASSSLCFLRYFSSYVKTKRMVAWILRYLKNSRTPPDLRCKGELLVSEIDAAEKALVKIVQAESFQEQRKSELKSLCVFEDKEGLLRVKTKLGLREDKEDFKTPMILPGRHELAKRLIYEEHIKLGHVGAQILLCKLRERFWIPKGRRTVKDIITACSRCKRFRVSAIKPVPAVLPEERVREALVFEIVGVDLAGPLILRDGKKSWIVLYTCAVYRAVHLELITSLSTNEFLQCLRRFIARRGRPKIIFSDNGTNFVGAENLFRNIDWNKIENEASSRRIQWKFNPPSAAWWGGWWERLIQIVKRMLRRVLGRASLSYEELNTLICDCEAIINNRPLTYVSEDTEDADTLTPSMFLQDSVSIGVPDLDHLDEVNITRRYRFLQRLRTDLRRRFRTEYLSQLVNHYSGRDCQYVLKKGDVVLIGSDNVKRLLWPLAKVLEVYPGKDGIVRVARLKTASGEIIRPVQRVFPLEMSDSRGMEPSDVPVKISTEEIDVPAKISTEEIDVPAKNSTEEITAPVEEEMPVTTRRGRRVQLPARYHL